jgi:hypothetical protein
MSTENFHQKKNTEFCSVIIQETEIFFEITNFLVLLIISWFVFLSIKILYSSDIFSISIFLIFFLLFLGLFR